MRVNDTFLLGKFPRKEGAEPDHLEWSVFFKESARKNKPGKLYCTTLYPIPIPTLVNAEPSTLHKWLSTYLRPGLWCEDSKAPWYLTPGFLYYWPTSDRKRLLPFPPVEGIDLYEDPTYVYEGPTLYKMRDRPTTRRIVEQIENGHGRPVPLIYPQIIIENF